MLRLASLLVAAPSYGCRHRWCLPAILQLATPSTAAMTTTPRAACLLSPACLAQLAESFAERVACLIDVSDP